MDKVERSWGLRAPCDDRNKCRSTREAIRHRPSLGVVRAKALPERVEAPAGLACPSPIRMPGIVGLIQPAGLARPQPGL